MDASQPANLPLRLGKPEEFSRVREFLLCASFDAPTLCRVLAMEDMSDLGRVAWDRVDMGTTPPKLHLCIELFVRGTKVPEPEARDGFGDLVFNDLLSLGLIRFAKKERFAVVCPVWAYPVAGFVMVSDRRDDPEGEPFVPAADVVFPAIYAGTLRFLRLLPEAGGGDALDLCGGSGIGALLLAGKARASVTADLTGRSAFFAEFNARLNALPVESLCGDLYAPVLGRTFDLIVAHPPFVPATGQSMVYRDAGETGEEVTRRLLQGLPDHLRPGGTSVVLCVARDTAEGPFERRVSDWLGAAALEFDIVFGLEKVLSVEGVIDSMRRRGQGISQVDAENLLERLRLLGTQQFVYGALVLRRYPEAISRSPLRFHLNPSGAAGDFERLLAWRENCRRSDAFEWLANARPCLAGNLELTARHIVRDGELIPVEFVFSIDCGFRAALRPDGWVVPLLAQLTGAQSVRQIFIDAKTAGELPEGFSLEAFVELVRSMVERGFMEVEFPGRPAFS